MWAVRWGVLFVGVSLAYCRQTYSAYSYPDAAEYSEYDEEEQTIPMRATTQVKSDPLARIRRYGTQPTRTPDPTTIDHTTDQTAAPIGTLTSIFGVPPTRTPDTTTTDEATDITTTPGMTATNLGTRLTRTPDPKSLEELKGAIKEILSSRTIDPTAATWSDPGNNLTDVYDTLKAARLLNGSTETTGTSWSTGVEMDAVITTADIPHRTNIERNTDGCEDPNAWQACTSPCGRQCTDYKKKDMCGDVDFACADNNCECKPEFVFDDIISQRCILPEKCPPDPAIEHPNTPSTTEFTNPAKESAANQKTKNTPHAFNIDALLDILSNITYDYEMDNILDLYNKTLLENTLPTCPTPTTTTPTTTTTLERFPIETTPVVAKCFVCGLDTPEIPRNAYCADAFAGDFIPLVPVDPSAKGQIARYRKYCRYMDVNNFRTDRREPRSVFGRWTGGCSVRWTDLSGVYTQRACRNNRHAATGRHFGSKRMAKLEMTLSNVKTGCIISPMASLLPLSRGISLFARFHACVCTGSWCNRAYNDRHRIPNYSILAIWLLSRIIKE